MKSASTALPLLSLIVPTRGRPQELARFVASLEATVAQPERIELILVVDADDATARDIPRARFAIKRREVRPGLSMSGLNNAGYDLAEGAWIFLLNDDIEVKTPGWDAEIERMTRLYADQICLIHVNDGIFGDKLCTFPLVSRKFCEIVGGICPTDYSRYRIDDHIYNVFNLLAFLGHSRILFAEHLLFDHLNRDIRFKGIESYRPNPVVHARDTEVFDASLPRRKQAALDLIDHIEAVRAGGRREIASNRMLDLVDSIALRRPEFVGRVKQNAAPAGAPPRVTIGIVTANLKVDFAQLCIDSVKRYTTNFDLILLDNNRGPNFNHPREMNRILSICRTDFLVLMDDDVIVEAGWLDGMLRAMGPDVGVVAPLHKDSAGQLSYAGVVLRPDDSGHHSHDYEVPRAPTAAQTLCSAIMLIDMRKCGHIRVDESYSKYFLDLDYGLRVWEAGYQVVQTPYTLVTHIGGATLQQGSTLSNELYEAQRTRFVSRWMQTGRWHELLQSGAWQADPHLRRIADFRQEIEALMSEATRALPREEFERRLRALFAFSLPRPALRAWAAEAVRAFVGEPGSLTLCDDNVQIALLAGYFIQPVLIEAGVAGLNIILQDGEYFAIPATAGSFDIGTARSGGYARCFTAPDLETLKVAIAAGIDVLPEAAAKVGRAANAGLPAVQRLRALEDGYKGFNILEFGQFYAVRQADGPFDASRLMSDQGLGRLAAPSLGALKAAIDALQPRLLQEGYRGYNLVEMETVYAIPQYEGEFDPVRARSGGYFGVIAAATAEAARDSIDRLGRLNHLKLRLHPWRHLLGRAARGVARRVLSPA